VYRWNATVDEQWSVQRRSSSSRTTHASSVAANCPLSESVDRSNRMSTSPVSMTGSASVAIQHVGHIDKEPAEITAEITAQTWRRDPASSIETAATTMPLWFVVRLWARRCVLDGRRPGTHQHVVATVSGLRDEQRVNELSRWSTSLTSDWILIQPQMTA